MTNDMQEIKSDIREIKTNVSRIQEDFNKHEKWEEGLLAEQDAFIRNAFVKAEKIYEELTAFKKKYEEDCKYQELVNLETKSKQKSFSIQIKIILGAVFIAYICMLILFLYVRNGAS